MVSRSTLFGLTLCVIAAACATVLAYLVKTEEKESLETRRLLLPGIAQYTSFRCKTDSFDLTCARNEAGEWRITQPFEARANHEVVQQFLDHFSCERVREQITRRRRRTRQLDDVLTEFARFEFSAPYSETATLLLKTTVQGDHLFVDGNIPDTSSGSLLALDPAFRDTLPAYAEDFRDNHLIPWQESQIGRLDLYHKGEFVLALQRDASGWVLSATNETQAPTQFPGNAPEITHLLRYLSGLRYASLHDHGAPTPERLANVHCASTNSLYSIRLRSDESSLIPFDRELRFGSEILPNADSTEPLPGAIYVYIPDDHVLGTIDSSVLASFQMEPEHIREHKLFPRVTPDNLLAIRFQDTLGSHISFQRKTSSAPWRLLQPADLPVESAPFEALLNPLLSLTDSHLQTESIPSPSDPIIASLELTLEGGTTLTARIHPGPTPDSSLWVLEGEPYAHCVDSTALPIRPWTETDILPLLRPAIPARIVALAPSSVKEFGLLPATDSRTLPTPNEPDAQRIILLGNTTDSGERFAMIRGTYTVYSIPTNLLDSLSAPLPQENHP